MKQQLYYLMFSGLILFSFSFLGCDCASIQECCKKGDSKSLSFIPSLLNRYDTESIDSLKSYNSTIRPTVKNPNISSDKIDLYVDVSGGMMHNGISAGEKILKKILEEIIFLNPTYYKIGENVTIEKFPFSKEEKVEKIWDYFTDMNSYRGKYSNLDVAPKEIVKNSNNVSIYITDFLIDQGSCEFPKGTYYKKEIMPWAKPEFTEWLKQGNKIDVFAKTYTGKPAGHSLTDNSCIYFMFFTPKDIILSETKINKLIGKLKNEFVGSDDIHYFEFRTDAISVERKYPCDTQSMSQNGGDVTEGLGEYLCIDSVTDFYSFSISGLIDGEQIPLNGWQKILTGLSLNNQLKYFQSPELEIKQYDITDNFVNYCNKHTVNNNYSPINYFSFKQGDSLLIGFNNIDKSIITSSRICKIDIVVKDGQYVFDNAYPDGKQTLNWKHNCGSSGSRIIDNSALYESLKQSLDAVEDEIVKKRTLFTYYILLNP